jgi:hypothetical protein
MTGCLTEETLHAYFDGELPPSVIGQVMKHLAECESCAAAAYELETAIQSIASAWNRELPDAVPSMAMRQRLQNELLKRERATKIVKSGRLVPRILASSFALLKTSLSTTRGLAYASVGLLLLIVSFWIASKTILSPREPAPPQEALRNRDQEKAPQKEKPDRLVERDPGMKENNQRIGEKRNLPRRLPSGPGERPPLVMDTTSIVASYQTAQQGLVGTDDSPELLDSTPFSRDVVSHFEKAQLLFRSFRNSDWSNGGSAPELAREQRISKSLLFQNILLRRSAEKAGNLPVGEVTNSLEPLLVDIANLPSHPSLEEVTAIKNRIQRTEIIAVLQVYSSPRIASN